MSAAAFSYWTGPVTWMERLSCATAVTAGHDVTIFTDAPAQLRPAGLGVRIEDAREVFDAGGLDDIQKRVPDHFSDWFRVEGLNKGLGTWFDLDMAVLQHLGREPYLMAWESPDSICGAVLQLPQDSPVLRDYLAFCRKRPVTHAPFWYPLPTRLNMQWKRVEKWVLGKPPPRLHYGPAALTHFTTANGCADKVLPQEVYFPFSPRTLSDMQVLVDGDALLDFITPNTRAVHLWRSVYKRANNGMTMPPRDSWLGRAVRGLDLAAVKAD